MRFAPPRSRHRGRTIRPQPIDPFGSIDADGGADRIELQHESDVSMALGVLERRGYRRVSFTVGRRLGPGELTLCVQPNGRPFIVRFGPDPSHRRRCILPFSADPVAGDPSDTYNRGAVIDADEVYP